MTISIDLETYSDVDIKTSGAYRYVESPNFEILLFGYSVDGGEVTVLDLKCGDEIPEDILNAIVSDDVIKWAFNASFERLCLSVYFKRNYPVLYGTLSEPYLSPESWRCSMVWAAYMGLPLSLEAVGKVLNLSEQKLDEGKALIRYFSMPCAPTKANGQRTRNLPEHAPDKWEKFKAYNKRDVEVEMAVQAKLKNFPVPDNVWDEYHLDQEINDRGILLDMDMVENAIRIDEQSREELMQRMKDITGLENPNSVAQMKAWLAENGVETDSLDKKAVASLLKTAPPKLKEVLELRQQLAKSSVKKYTAMQNLRCSDGRAHGCFQFYGANRSGRWAGRHIQLQNLPQNHMPDLEQARELVKQCNYDALRMLYDNVPAVLSELIRTAFVPMYGYKFIVSDFSAIEARVLSFLAGEEWRMEVFANNGDIYCASASEMFGVPVEKHGQNGHLRQKGKIAELALGYGGSVGALKSMGALDQGLQEEELQPLVDAWRSANPNIVEFWWAVDRAVKEAVIKKTTTQTHGIMFSCRSGMLFIRLPSGRKLAYVKPHMGINQFGSESVLYYGVDGQKKWSEIESYGPKFVENIVQAISRDILCHAMKTLRYCRIVAHVHDEIIIECSMGVSLDAVCEQMGRTPPWIRGLLLRADGYECSFYKKD